MRVNRLDWNDNRREHIARHKVSVEEVEDIAFGKHYAIRTKQGRYRLIGQTEEGRYLVVILEPGDCRIPKFKSYEEEAQWWDTHDTTEFEDEFKPVKLEFAKPLAHILGIRLDAKTIDLLNQLGSEIGVGPSTLVRMWIMEKLKSFSRKSKQSQASSQAILHKISKQKSKKR